MTRTTVTSVAVGPAETENAQRVRKSDEWRAPAAAAIAKRQLRKQPPGRRSGGTKAVAVRAHGVNRPVWNQARAKSNGQPVDAASG